MPRPRFMKAPVPKVIEPRPAHKDDLEKHISQTNRQGLPYESPMASFARAKARTEERHDRSRKAQQLVGNTANKRDLAPATDLAEAERDWHAMRHYRHHFTDMRGTLTVKRENIIVKK